MRKKKGKGPWDQSGGEKKVQEKPEASGEKMGGESNTRFAQKARVWRKN